MEEADFYGYDFCDCDCNCDCDVAEEAADYFETLEERRIVHDEMRRLLIPEQVSTT